MNDHINPLLGSILDAFSVPAALEQSEKREQARRRRERLRRDALQQFARDLEEALGLEYLAVDAGALSACLDQYESRCERLGVER
jgi:hypothetical protein